MENSATGCTSYSEVTLSVEQGPVVNTPIALVECDPNSDGITTFDLQAAFEQISGGPVPAGTTITAHETLEDAQLNQNPWPSPYLNITPYNQPLFIRVSFDANGCTTIVELPLVVVNTPRATEIDPLFECDDNADGYAEFDLNLATPGLLDTLSGADHTVTYYLSENDALLSQNPITGIGAFTNTVANTQTIWANVMHNATGCFDVISFLITVNPLPGAPTPVPSYTVCDVNNPGDQMEEFDLNSVLDDILGTNTGFNVTFHETSADALGDTNPIGPLYTNELPNPQTIFVRVENASSGCFMITTLDLRVEPLPVLLEPTGPITQCDPNNDGVEVFDLDALEDQMVNGGTGLTVTFHETLTDAQSGSAPIPNPDTYSNIQPFVQIIYVRVVDSGTGCHNVFTVELNTISSPKVPVLDPLTECDDDAIPTDNATDFDLTVQTPVILAGQTTTGNYIVEYYTSEQAAIDGLLPILPPTSFHSDGTSPQTVWVRISDQDGECFDVGSFQLFVNSPLALTNIPPYSLCDDGPTSALPQMAFDLLSQIPVITQNLPGYQVIFYPSLADAQADTNPISATLAAAYVNQTNPQTLGVAVVSGDGCRSITTMDIRVLPLPAPLVDPEPLEACDVNTPVGTEEFDLTTNQDYIADGDLGLVFEYYTSYQNAVDGVNMISDPTQHEGSGTIFIKVRNSQIGQSGEYCYVIIEQLLIVNPIPVVTNEVYTICDENNTGFGVFQLAGNDSLADDLLDSPQVTSDFTFTYHLTLADAQNGVGALGMNYTNTTIDTQVIYVRVENNATGCVDTDHTVTLVVAEGALIAQPAVSPLVSCDTDGLNDGVFNSFDLTVMTTEILAGQDATLFSVSYYSDAATTQLIQTPSAWPSATGFVYAVVNNLTTGCESDVIAIPVTVEMLPTPDIDANTDGNTICVDFTTGAVINGLLLDGGLFGANYTYQWAVGGVDIPNATSATYMAMAPGDYTLTVTSSIGLGCIGSDTFTVIQSGPPVFVGQGYTVTNAFADNNTITVNVQGYGNYEYSIDNGPWQSSNVFTNVGPGEHTIQVQDANYQSCGADAIVGVNIIDYPVFFTPNGDGFNDTWNIIGLDDTAKIYIFDRYGKLLKQLSPTGEGWDGTYNGQLLPSTDYWFSVEYFEGAASKEFRAHFSLKR